ncbi:MAG: hypothetical protein KDC79_09470 [Cyclobacteriaceae bacterium]|nr:hypothetical protein [Cyclobacteriaceae bacterium]
MKRIVLIGLAISLTLSINGMAQRNRNEFSTIFNKEDSNKIEHGGYGSFGFGYSKINGKDALLANFKAAWLINHRLGFGFAGNGFVNNLDKKLGTQDYYLSGGYGGFLIEPIVMPKSPIHLSFPVIIGAGGIAVLPNNFWSNNYYGPNEYDIFFVVEPGAELEFNVVKFFRISMGASYRFTNGVLLNTPDNEAVNLNAMDGITYNINFKFGKF